MGDVLIGRETESLALDAALADAASATRGVLVTGPAGIGKSALVRAFLVRARSTGALTLVASGLPSAGVELPYAPVVQMVRALRRDHPGVLDDAVGPQAAAVIAPLVPDVLDAAGSEPTADVATPGLERSRLLSALAGTVEMIARRSPVVLVVEDLHWVDGSTLALLGLLLRGTPHAGLLVVATSREPGSPQRIRQWCAVERAAGRLDPLPVPALTLAETERLLGTLGDAVPGQGRASEVHRRSGGNPFLVRELACVAPGAMPDSVRDLLRVDLDALPDAGRQVAATVAVAGRPVGHTLLAAVLGTESAAQGASAAVGAGMLDLNADSYGFGHELARSAVYDVLLPAERQHLHAALAAALARRADRSVDARDLVEIAWHFGRADNAADTASWGLRAASATERIGDFSAAQQQLERVLAVSDDPAVGMTDEQLVALRQRAAHAADYAGQTTEALAHLDAALVLVDPTTDAQRAGLVQAHRSWLLMVLDRVEEASDAAELAVRLLPADATPAARSEVHLRAALVLGSTGRMADAVRSAVLALHAAVEADDERLIGRAMRELGSWGSPDELTEPVADLLEGAWVRALAAGDAEDVAGVGVIMSERLFRAGRLEAAAHAALAAHDALATVAETGHWMDGILITNACQALLAVGRWDEAAGLLDRACALDDFGVARLSRARLRIARGDLDLAEADLRASRHLQRHDQPYFGLDYDEAWAELLLWQGRPHQAMTVVSDVLDTLDDGALRDLGHVLCLLGLRAAADLAADARAQRANDVLVEAETTGRRLAVVAAEVLAKDAALSALAEGELGRLDERPNPAAWELAAGAWTERHQTHRCSYSRWRQAEALLEVGAGRKAAAPPLQEAAVKSQALGAAGLLAEIQALARRARVPLQETADHRSPARPSVGVGALSEREISVLRLIALGRTNREIGQELYISPKTVSVHVTRLMQKLGVHSRVQAAAIAHRSGIS